MYLDCIKDFLQISIFLLIRETNNMNTCAQAREISPVGERQQLITTMEARITRTNQNMTQEHGSAVQNCVPLNAHNVLGIIFCCLTNIRERQIKALQTLYTSTK